MTLLFILHVTLSTQDFGKVNLTFGEHADEGLARAKKLGPENAGQQEYTTLNDKNAGLPSKAFYHAVAPQQSLILNQRCLSAICPSFVSREGERPRSGASSGSCWASFWRLSAALMRFTLSSSK
jgi:hypothetical protein